MDTLKKLMSKKQKEGKPLSENEKNAKMSVVQALQDFAKGQMGDKLHGMKKVSVASDTSEGLEKGLDVAKGALSGKIPSPDTHEDNDAEEAAETPSDEAAEMASDGHDGIQETDDTSASETTPAHGDHIADMDEHTSEEELDAKLAHLMALKKKKQAHKA